MLTVYMDPRSKTARESPLSNMVKAIDTQFSDVKSMMMHGKEYTPAGLKALLQEELDAMAKTRHATAARTDAVNRERALTARNKPVLDAFHDYLVARHGGDSATLKTFSFSPRRKGKRTVAVKAKAAEKAKETRKTLGTLGRKQRKKKARGAA
jgi:hypothetical protein